MYGEFNHVKCDQEYANLASVTDSVYALSYFQKLKKFVMTFMQHEQFIKVPTIISHN